jgi:hypothetical protein
MKKHFQTIKTIKSQSTSFQHKIENLSDEQRLILLDLLIRKIQLDISQNKSLLKDVLDGGLGLIPILGDFTQVLFSIQLIWSIKKQLNKIDLKILLPITLLTLTDIIVGLFIGPGDLLDFAMTTNYFIEKYIEKLFHQSLEKAKNNQIDPELIKILLKDPKKYYRNIQK